MKKLFSTYKILIWCFIEFLIVAAGTSFAIIKKGYSFNILEICMLISIIPATFVIWQFAAYKRLKNTSPEKMGAQENAEINTEEVNPKDDNEEINVDEVISKADDEDLDVDEVEPEVDSEENNSTDAELEDDNEEVNVDEVISEADDEDLSVNEAEPEVDTEETNSTDAELEDDNEEVNVDEAGDEESDELKVSKFMDNVNNSDFIKETRNVINSNHNIYFDYQNSYNFKEVNKLIKLCKEIDIPDGDLTVQNKIAELLGLSIYKVNAAIKTLKEYNMLETHNNFLKIVNDEILLTEADLKTMENAITNMSYVELLAEDEKLKNTSLGAYKKELLTNRYLVLRKKIKDKYEKADSNSISRLTKHKALMYYLDKNITNEDDLTFFKKMFETKDHNKDVTQDIEHLREEILMDKIDDTEKENRLDYIIEKGHIKKDIAQDKVYEFETTVVGKISKFYKQFQDGIITEEEFEKKKSELLNQ